MQSKYDLYVFKVQGVIADPGSGAIYPYVKRWLVDKKDLGIPPILSVQIQASMEVLLGQQIGCYLLPLESAQDPIELAAELLRYAAKEAGVIDPLRGVLIGDQLKDVLAAMAYMVEQDPYPGYPQISAGSYPQFLWH